MQEDISHHDISGTKYCLHRIFFISRSLCILTIFRGPLSILLLATEEEENEGLPLFFCCYLFWELSAQPGPRACIFSQYLQSSRLIFIHLHNFSLLRKIYSVLTVDCR